MKFCPDCNNSLYIKQSSDKIIFYCMVCNYEEKANTAKYYYKDYGEQKCQNYRIETYKSLCDDATIPITKTEKCKNKDCKDSKIIFIKCNTLNNIYICCKCNDYWYSD